MGWFNHSYAELLKIPLGAGYLPANQGQGYEYEQITIQGGNIGIGRVHHAQENNNIYYSKNSLVLNEQGNHQGFYRQGLLTTNSEITEELSTNNGNANRQLQGGVLLIIAEQKEGIYQTSLQEKKKITYTQTTTGVVNVLAHQLLSQEEKITFYRTVGEKYYEHKDHLGNVRVVFSDRKVATYTNNTLTSYQAEIVSFTNYYPFGWA